MTSRKAMPRWFPVIFLLLGAYIVLISLGVLPYSPSTRKRAVFDNPQHWQITGMGIAFFCAGLSLLVAQRGGRWLSVLIGTVFLASFLSPMVWFVHFSGVLGLPMRILFTVPLALGGAGAVFGLVRTAQGKSATLSLADDPVMAANVFLAHGRTAQAQAVLLQAMQRDPARAAEFQSKLEEIRRAH